jgi:1,4-alpha-glucan branching enzyme
MLKKLYSKTKPVCKVTFSLPVEAAPQAERVLLLGDFNEWHLPQGVEMKKKGNQFEAALDLDAGKQYAFRYLIDGSQWENDWQADAYVASPFAGVTNSLIQLDPVVVDITTKATPAKKVSTAKPAVAQVKEETPEVKPVVKAAAKEKAPVAKKTAKK